MADIAPFAHSHMYPEKYTMERIKKSHRFYTIVGTVFIVVGFILSFTHHPATTVKILTPPSSNGPVIYEEPRRKAA